MKKDCLEERIRAEDILLGSLGFGAEAKIVSVKSSEDGYQGVACWPDGEQFQFASDGELDKLQRWALEVLAKESRHNDSS